MKTISILGLGWLGKALAIEALERGEYIVYGNTRQQETKQFFLDFNSEEERRSATLEERAKVAALDSKQQPSTPARLKLFSVNVPHFTPVDADFFKTDVLIITLPPGRRRENVIEAYTQEIAAVLEMAVQNNCGQIIYTSSTGVYGPASGPVTENTPADPATPASRSVLAAENLVRSAPLPATILRLAGLYGPDRHPGRWFSAKSAIENSDAPVNLVHQADVVQAILSIIQQEAWDETYNVCAKAHPSKGEFYTRAVESLGITAPTTIAGGSTGKKIDSSKIRKELGWAPKHDDLLQF